MVAGLEKLIQKPLFMAVRYSCPFCQGALKLADKHGIKPELVDVLADGGADVKSALEAKTGQKTVPFVFSKGRFIGGYTELKSEPESFWTGLK